MRARGACLSVLVSLAAALCAGGCGASHERVVVRVGASTIGSGMLAQWMAATAPGHDVPDPPRFARCTAQLAAHEPEAIAAALAEECRARYESLKQRALASLIAARWLVGEARERGIALPGGELPAQARAAEAALRRAQVGADPRVTSAQLTAYYEQNQADFGRPERRYIDIVERIATKARAQTVLERVRRRGNLHSVAIREVFDEENLARVVPWKRSILGAIFTATPHAIVGPLPLNEKWCFFEVTRTVPRDLKPLAQVQGSIERRLAGERERLKLAPFIAAWRRKWAARTRCSAGYVVQKCSEYRGPKSPEAPTSFS